MNGHELFEKLKEMSEDDRKKCQYFQLSDSRLATAYVQDAIDDMVFVNGDENRDDIENAANAITPDDIASMGDAVIDESETAFDEAYEYYLVDFRRRLVEAIETKIIENVTEAKA